MLLGLCWGLGVGFISRTLRILFSLEFRATIWAFEQIDTKSIGTSCVLVLSSPASPLGRMIRTHSISMEPAAPRLGSL
jgi:hypothetical protein